MTETVAAAACMGQAQVEAAEARRAAQVAFPLPPCPPAPLPPCPPAPLPPCPPAPLPPLQTPRCIRDAVCHQAKYNVVAGELNKAHADVSAGARCPASIYICLDQCVRWRV